MNEGNIYVLRSTPTELTKRKRAGVWWGEARAKSMSRRVDLTFGSKEGSAMLKFTGQAGGTMRPVR